MTVGEFILVVLSILLMPGPTNTLIALASTQVGFRRALNLLPAEICGYLSAVLPIAYLGTMLLERFPKISPLLHLASASWVMWIAINLWRQSVADIQLRQVNFWQVFVTTFLNPKALLFGLVLLQPTSDAAFPLRLALFGSSICAVALIWLGIGSIAAPVPTIGGKFQLWINRGASVWLMVASAGIAARGFLK